MKKLNINRPPLTEEQERRKVRRAALIKMAAMGIFVVVVMVFSSIAWFTVNKEVEGTGATMKAGDSMFEIKTSGSTGLYDSYISRVDSEYSNDLQSSNANHKITWHLTKSNASDTDGNMKNLYTGENPNLAEITKLESSDYGLSPGDYGTLKFSIVPKTSEVFSVEIKTDMTCFRTEYYETGSQAGYQKDVFTEIEDNAANHDVLQYANNHITFYYLADEDDDDTPEMHLIKDGVFTVSNISQETEVTIYWAWAKNLINIIGTDVDGIDQNGATELRDAFFLNPSAFLEDVTGRENFNLLTISSNVDDFDEAVSDKVAYLTANANRTTYNGYKSMYNNADQTIGDEVGYIMFEMSVDLKND